MGSDRSPLERALDRALGAYARHLLTGERRLPTFRARFDGPRVLVDVEASDGVQHVAQRASAYLLLAGAIWGASRGADERRALPALIATLTSHPDGGSNENNKFFQFRSDADWFEGVEELAIELERGAREEAVLLLRRLYEVDNNYGPDRTLYGPRMEPRRVRPSSIASRVGARSPVTREEDWFKSTTPQAVVKKVIPFASSKNAEERLAAAMRISAALPQLLYSNHLSFFALVDGVLPALLEEGDGAIYEVALGIAQGLGAKLLYHRAYAEAAKLLDLVVPLHVAPAETPRMRWECRLYLGIVAGDASLEQAAEEDWQRASRFDSPTDPSSLGHCMFWSGDVTDRRSTALSRVATALVTKANGGDPCKDRKLTKKTPRPSAADKERLLARAAGLTGSAMEVTEARADRDRDQARTAGAVTSRGFQADDFAARAKVREASGDLAGALADYRSARELRIVGGLSWQIDNFGPEVRRLAGRLAGHDPKTMPPSFEPDWLINPERSTTEREAAATRWSKEPWRGFPSTPKEAIGRPYAYVLLRDALARSADIWKLAAESGVSLGDRVAFASRALTLLDLWCDRRDASALEHVLDESHSIAWFGDREWLPEQATARARAPVRVARGDGGRVAPRRIRGATRPRRRAMGCARAMLRGERRPLRSAARPLRCAPAGGGGCRLDCRRAPRLPATLEERLVDVRQAEGGGSEMGEVGLGARLTRRQARGASHHRLDTPAAKGAWPGRPATPLGQVALAALLRLVGEARVAVSRGGEEGHAGQRQAPHEGAAGRARRVPRVVRGARLACRCATEPPRVARRSVASSSVRQVAERTGPFCGRLGVMLVWIMRRRQSRSTPHAAM